jgi:hypothetical protein
VTLIANNYPTAFALMRVTMMIIEMAQYEITLLWCRRQRPEFAKAYDYVWQ